MDRTYSNKLNTHDKKLVPGFTTTGKNRPLIISKLECCFRERSLIIKSIRLYDELNVFVWNGPKAEAMRGYNDDLVMCYNTAMYVRDTALKQKQYGIEMTKATLNNIQRPSQYQGAYFASGNDNPYTMDINGEKEDLKWLF